MGPTENSQHPAFVFIMPLALSVCLLAVINTLLRDSDLCLILSNLFEHTKGKAPDNVSV